jgi:hypothetical protein
LAYSVTVDVQQVTHAGFSRIGVELQEFTDDGVGFEANDLRVGADEGTTKNTRRPMRQVIPLQAIQQRQTDLRLGGNGGKRNVLSFTLLAQSSAETLDHVADLTGHEQAARRNHVGVDVGVDEEKSSAILIAREGTVAAQPRASEAAPCG